MALPKTHKFPPFNNLHRKENAYFSSFIQKGKDFSSLYEKHLYPSPKKKSLWDMELGDADQ